jgi:hypothetical protein
MPITDEASLRTALAAGGRIDYPAGLTINVTTPLTLQNGTILDGPTFTRGKLNRTTVGDLFDWGSLGPTDIHVNHMDLASAGKCFSMADRTSWGVSFRNNRFTCDDIACDFYNGVADAHNYGTVIEFNQFINQQTPAIRGDFRFFRFIRNDINGTRTRVSGAALIEIAGLFVTGIIEQGVHEPTTDWTFLSIDGRGTSAGEVSYRGNWDENNAVSPTSSRMILRSVVFHAQTLSFEAAQKLTMSDNAVLNCEQLSALSGGVPFYDEASVANVLNIDAGSSIFVRKRKLFGPPAVDEQVVLLGA